MGFVTQDLGTGRNSLPTATASIAKREPQGFTAHLFTHAPYRSIVQWAQPGARQDVRDLKASEIVRCERAQLLGVTSCEGFCRIQSICDFTLLKHRACCALRVHTYGLLGRLYASALRSSSVILGSICDGTRILTNAVPAQEAPAMRACDITCLCKYVDRSATPGSAGMNFQMQQSLSKTREEVMSVTNQPQLSECDATRRKARPGEARLT